MKFVLKFLLMGSFWGWTKMGDGDFTTMQMTSLVCKHLQFIYFPSLKSTKIFKKYESYLDNETKDIQLKAKA